MHWVTMAGGQPDQILGAFWRTWMGGLGLEAGGQGGGRGWDPGDAGGVVGTSGGQASLGVSLRWEHVGGDLEV